MENINESIKAFVGNEGEKETPKKEEVVIKKTSGLMEVKQLEKKIITEDGRQLLT